MRLCITCNYCFEENTLPMVARARTMIKLDNTNHYQSRCTKCGAANSNHVNDIYSKVSRLGLLLLFFASVFASIYLMVEYYNSYIVGRSLNIGLRGVGILAFVGVVPIFIWSVFYKADLDKCRVLNDHRI